VAPLKKPILVKRLDTPSKLANAFLINFIGIDKFDAAKIEAQAFRALW